MITGSHRVETAIRASDRAAERRDFVSWSRLLWVGPLTVVVALLVNLGLAAIVRALNPAYAEMGQLGRSNMILTVEGAILAVIVFALMVWLVPHPIRWYRRVGLVALLISLIPDLLLGLGGDLRRTGSAMVAPFSRFGAQFFPAPAGGGRPAGGGPSATDVLPGMPWDQVLVLMVLHVATAMVCIVLLTTLTREPAGSRPRDPRSSGARPLT
jgi:hypothetical protein